MIHLAMSLCVCVFMCGSFLEPATYLCRQMPGNLSVAADRVWGVCKGNSSNGVTILSVATCAS